MKANRRDILRFFAAGTVIAPATGETVLARLVEPPKVEIVPPGPTKPFSIADCVRVRISFEMGDGTHHVFERKGRGHGTVYPHADVRIDLYTLGSPPVPAALFWSSHE